MPAGGTRIATNHLTIWVDSEHAHAKSEADHDWLYFGRDLWDALALVDDSGGGITIDRIRVGHSSQTILDWSGNVWLDGSKLEEYASQTSASCPAS